MGSDSSKFTEPAEPEEGWTAFAETLPARLQRLQRLQWQQRLLLQMQRKLKMQVLLLMNCLVSK